MEMEKYHEILETSSKVMNELSDSTMARIDEDDNTGVGRTYECSYCKRGFTNAQALGGHMNIHRKDKAKAKQQQQQQQNYYSSSSLPKIPYNYNNNNNNININEGLSCYPNPNFSQQMSIYGPNNLYYPSYNSNNNNNNYTYPFVNTMPTQTPFYGNTRDFSSGRSRLFGKYDEHLGTDLSLRTNSSSNVNNFHQGEENKNEDKYGSIDLELRLGYDP